MQLMNGSRDDDIVGPVASGFWHAIADEVERLEHGDESGHPSKKRLSLVSEETPKPETGRAAPDKSEPEKPTVVATAGEEATAGIEETAGVEETTASNDETTADVDDDHASEAKRSHRLRRFFVSNFRMILLVAVIAGLAVALALTSISLGNKSSAAAASTSALQAAKTYAVEVGGYNFQNMNQDFGAVLADSTPAFRANFSQASGALRSTLVKYHASATAKVVAAGLVSSTSTSAVALVFLDQSVTNSLQKSATTDRTQVEINLLLQKGKWLINNVTLL
jgi:Mce-associated membrane protein